MFTQISRCAIIASLCLAPSACGGGDAEDMPKAAKGDRVECALAGNTAFYRNCRTERVSGPEGQLLVMRHPDGGFRRFKILTDGRGLVPADGFDPDFKLSVMGDGMIEVRSVDDIYRLPAAISGEKAK
jgi:hypothetical protein